MYIKDIVRWLGCGVGVDWNCRLSISAMSVKIAGRSRSRRTWGRYLTTTHYKHTPTTWTLTNRTHVIVTADIQEQPTYSSRSLSRKAGKLTICKWPICARFLKCVKQVRFKKGSIVFLNAADYPHTRVVENATRVCQVYLRCNYNGNWHFETMKLINTHIITYEAASLRQIVVPAIFGQFSSERSECRQKASERGLLAMQSIKSY